MTILNELMPKLIPEGIPVYHENINSGQVLPTDCSVEQFYSASEKIIHQTISSLSPETNSVILHTAGTVSSGKSVCCKTLLQSPAYKNYLFLQFDEIMKALPHYKIDSKHIPLEKTFNRWELPARILGYHILEKAIVNKFNILFEHSASLRSHVDLLKNMKDQHGYTTKILYLNPPDDVILRRLQIRKEKQHRYTPPHYMQERKAKIKRLIPFYKQNVDLFVEFTGEDNDYTNFDRETR